MTGRGRAVTYNRVSTTDQDPTLARVELRAACEGRDLELVREIEEVCSGAETRRPGLIAVLELVRKRKADHVLVWKVDRFGRGLVDLLLNLQELELHRARFIATSQGINIGPSATASERMQLQVIAVMAEYERTLAGERTMLGLARLAVELERAPPLERQELAAFQGYALASCLQLAWTHPRLSADTKQLIENVVWDLRDALAVRGCSAAAELIDRGWTDRG
jgi:hypothetical protein